MKPFIEALNRIATEEAQKGAEALELLAAEGRNDLMLLTLTGSRGYQIHRSDSDWDFIAITVPDNSVLFGTKHWESQHTHTEDIDIRFYSLRKYMRLLAKGSPNHLEMLFLPSLYKHPIFARVFKHKHCFVGPGTIHAILGHARSTLLRFDDVTTCKDGSKRKRYIKTYGYDISAATHAARWLMMGSQILRPDTGLTMVLDENDASMLRRIKGGEIEVHYATSMIEEAMWEVEQMYEARKEEGDFFDHYDPTMANILSTEIHQDLLGVIP